MKIEKARWSRQWADIKKLLMITWWTWKRYGLASHGGHTVWTIYGNEDETEKKGKRSGHASRWWTETNHYAPLKKNPATSAWIPTMWCRKINVRRWFQTKKIRREEHKAQTGKRRGICYFDGEFQLKPRSLCTSFQMIFNKVVLHITSSKEIMYSIQTSGDEFTSNGQTYTWKGATEPKKLFKTCMLKMWCDINIKRCFEHRKNL